MNRAERRSLARGQKLGEPRSVKLEYGLGDAGHECVCMECMIEARARGENARDFSCAKCGLLHIRMVSCWRHVKVESPLELND